MWCRLVSYDYLCSLKKKKSILNPRNLWGWRLSLLIQLQILHVSTRCCSSGVWLWWGGSICIEIKSFTCLYSNSYLGLAWNFLDTCVLVVIFPILLLFSPDQKFISLVHLIISYPWYFNNRPKGNPKYIKYIYIFNLCIW